MHMYIQLASYKQLLIKLANYIPTAENKLTLKVGLQVDLDQDL